MKKNKTFIQFFTVRHSWDRVARWVFIETCNSLKYLSKLFYTKFIYHLYVNACIFGFLMSYNKEKIHRIIFLLSRCVALRYVKLPLNILTWLHLVDLCMYLLWHKIPKYKFEVCQMTSLFMFCRKQVSRGGSLGTRHQYHL